VGEGSGLDMSRAGRRIIERPRLMRLLTESESRVMLLVAPAGYGKTTLARQWLDDRPHIWFQATPDSTDLAALALGVATAAFEIVPNAADRMRGQLKGTADLSEPAVIADALVANLETWPSDIRLVVDDYHFITGASAERFVELLVSRTSIPLLITSRVRPGWVTAKKLLYGDAIELGRTTLAMTHEEAATTLARGHEEMPGLASLAQGWPAVIGLAAFMRSPVSRGDDEVPETLHEFFAEELYSGLPVNLRWGLTQLAIAPSLDDDVAQSVLRTRAAQVLNEGHEAGFLSRGPGGCEMHPLLRQFLLTKVREFSPEEVAATAEVLAETYVGLTRWDDAVRLAGEQGMPGVVLEVLGAALEQVLSEGRVTTVNRWLEHARAIAPTASVVRLAEIEVAFRTGDASRAREGAPELVRSIAVDDPLASRVYFSAGQIAHIDDRLDEAVRLFTAAEDAAKTPADFRRALWSRFVSLTDLDDQQGAASALQTFEQAPAFSTDDVLRARQGRIQSALRWGGLGEALEGTTSTLELLPNSQDPVVRTGFLQTYGIALVLAARYEEAAAIAQEELRQADRFKLDWVIPHALEMQACAALGLRDFRHALRILRKVQRLASGNRQELSVDVIRARVYLANGAPERAVDLINGREYSAWSPGMQGNYLATLGLAQACMNRIRDAENLFDAAEAVSTHIDARVLTAFGRSITGYLASNKRTMNPGRLSQACELSLQTGNFDSFVTAYRACPAIVPHFDGIDTDNAVFIRLVNQLDTSLARSLGLRPARQAHSDHALTSRELEVLGLLQQGLSNRQIARTLWIVESTVKVHIQHVFEKLGVHTRTEAAAIAQEIL
jgi:LuxR family maltose regulon positive regulatory protein